MFGKRSDGKLLKDIDPIIALTPYLMPMRCDAQVMMDFQVDYAVLTRYIVEQGQKNIKITFLELLIAAFVRTVAEHPEVNRFIVNKRLYSRNQLSVSFAVLKNTEVEGAIEENTVKCCFDPTDTIFDVARRVSDAIKESRKVEADNASLKIAKFFLNPFLANTLVGLIRVVDRYGLLPRFLIDASPFHTSLFVTNMASIGMPAVKHHIYNFGTTTMFFSIGSVQRTVEPDKEGHAVRKRVLPFGVVADERICAGAVYAKLVAGMLRYLNNPSLLEQPPEKVLFEENNSYSVPKPGADDK